MSKCPHCKQEIILKDVNRETMGAGFSKTGDNVFLYTL